MNRRYLRTALKKVPILAVALASMGAAVHGTGGEAQALTATDCRGCHGTGTTLSTTTTHHALVNTKGYTCDKCHQQIPDGSGGYTVTVTHDCLVCHVNATHELVHNTITRPTDCAQCHTLSVVDEHTSRGSTCSTCHDSTISEVQKAITDGKAGLPVSCLTCHTSISAAGHVHPYLQTSAECSTCHTMAPLDEHFSRGSTCATCHSSTNTAVVNTIAVGKTGVMVNCVNCHGASYAHPSAHTKTYVPYADCTTCHTGDLPTLHQAEGFACATCHGTSASAAVKDAVSASATGTTIRCATCHTTFGNHAAQHDKVTVPAGTNFITTHETSSPTSYCIGCHTTTTAARVKAIDDGMKGIAVSCTTCHPTMIPANVAPIANAGPDVTAVTGQAVSFTGAASTDSDGTIASYHWNFGDGATATGVTASHAFATAGSYWVTLTVTDNAGATATDTVIVTVQQGVAYTAVDEALSITRLSTVTTADTSGTRATVTTNFKDNNLTTGYAVNYSSTARTYSVATMRVNRDANAATKVVLRFYVSTISGTQTVKVYPYASGFSSVNTASSASYSITGTGWKELDVTTLAKTMNGLGAMKFRLTTTGAFSVSEGNFTIQ